MALHSSNPVYNKIFTKILDSSIWLEPNDTRIVWLTCIAAMDEDGFVQFASVANLARRANVELDAAQKAVERLEGPDPESSDPDNEGRRLERVQGGWIVLNAEKYRSLVTRVVIREQTRERVKRFRASKAVKSNGRNAKKRNSNAPVTPSGAVSEAQAEKDTKNLAPNTSAPKEGPNPDVKAFLDWFPSEYRRLRHGADYLVKFDRDGPLVKAMLRTTPLPRLRKLAQVMLSEKCEERFIVETDRGIQILSTKFNWLSDRLAAWEARAK